MGFIVVCYGCGKRAGCIAFKERKHPARFCRGRDWVGPSACHRYPEPRQGDGHHALASSETKAIFGKGFKAIDGSARAGSPRPGMRPMRARWTSLAQAKLRAVREMAATGGVIEIGYGVNDAPALKQASVGVAMGSGTDVAPETADAAIQHDKVTDVAAATRPSRATMANIRQNVAVALGPKAVLLITTAAGITGLWIAIPADTGGMVPVNLNVPRLLRSNPNVGSNGSGFCSRLGCNGRSFRVAGPGLLGQRTGHSGDRQARVAFGRATGRDRSAAIGFRVGFALAFFGPLHWLVWPLLNQVDPL